MSGKLSCSLGQYRQWVTARLPSSAPVQANANAPRQTDAIRRALGTVCMIHFICAVSWRNAHMRVTPGKATIAIRLAGSFARKTGRRGLADFEGILSFRPFEAGLYSWTWDSWSLA